MSRSPLRSVPLAEWPAVLASAAVAVGVEIGLRTTTLPRVAALVGAPLSDDADGPVRMGTGHPPVLTAAARRRVRATRRVMRHWPLGDTCLRQALVSGQRLRRLHPVLRVGVAKIDGQVRAHAWLEIDGAVLDPLGSAASYTPLAPVRTRSTP